LKNSYSSQVSGLLVVLLRGKKFEEGLDLGVLKTLDKNILEIV
jgi:hypothetical protein